MERFFPLEHLTTGQLRRMYRDARKLGKLLIEYDQPGVEGHYELDLPEDQVLENISAESQNYLVFHENFENEPDATTVAFLLLKYPFTTVYVDIDNARLNWFVKKYSLMQWWQMKGSGQKYYPFARFYTLEPVKRHLLN